MCNNMCMKRIKELNLKVYATTVYKRLYTVTLVL